jgi:hypothetical protein
MIFGRTGPLADDFQPEFEAWNQKSAMLSALAHNLRFDDRVSEAREKSLHEIWTKKRAVQPNYTLFKALERYKEERVYTNQDSDLLDRHKNGGNFCEAGRYGKSLPPVGVELLRIIDLSRLVMLFQQPWVPRVELFQRFYPAPIDPKRFLVWLDENMGSARTQEDFIRAVFAVINEALESAQNKSVPAPVFPSWVTVADDVEPDVARMAQRMGIDFPIVPTWACLLKYPADRAGTTVRPCHLDAGGNHLHFPSPGSLQANRGGHPMDLRPETGERRLPREYVHSPIRMDWDYFLKPQRIESRPDISLAKARTRHMERLRNEYLWDWDPQWMNPHLSGPHRMTAGGNR